MPCFPTLQSKNKKKKAASAASQPQQQQQKQKQKQASSAPAEDVADPAKAARKLQKKLREIERLEVGERKRGSVCMCVCVCVRACVCVCVRVYVCAWWFVFVLCFFPFTHAYCTSLFQEKKKGGEKLEPEMKAKIRRKADIEKQLASLSL